MSVALPIIGRDEPFPAESLPPKVISPQIKFNIGDHAFLDNTGRVSNAIDYGGVAVGRFLTKVDEKGFCQVLINTGDILQLKPSYIYR